jgi:hypothetical protein
MHIRTSRVRRNGKTYEYAQLVETHRRPSDGMPVHRVIATLGNVNDVAVRNLREALAASRQGRRVAVARVPAGRLRAPKPDANLRYLDLAVLLELWRGWGLDTLLDELLPEGEASLPAASIVAALSMQRCVDPGSKLYATRWLPRTALVELLGIAPRSFNNTRVHRVLDDLDAATTALMAKLPRRYARTRRHLRFVVPRRVRYVVRRSRPDDGSAWQDQGGVGPTQDRHRAAVQRAWLPLALGSDRRLGERHHLHAPHADLRCGIELGRRSATGV